DVSPLRPACDPTVSSVRKRIITDARRLRWKQAGSLQTRIRRTIMVPPTQDFFYENVECWDDLIKRNKNSKEGRWLYRGQAADWCLTSTLERHINSWQIDLNHAPSLEGALAREFRRRARGKDQ